MTTSTTVIRRTRIRRSEQWWRALFVRFEQSGQTGEQFCAEQGLALSTFARWRQRVRLTGREQAIGSPEGMFMELSSEQTTAPVTPAWDVELQLGGGVVVRLRRAAC